jgi:hypothetical protein
MNCEKLLPICIEKFLPEFCFWNTLEDFAKLLDASSGNVPRVCEVAD